jgi:integrase
MSTNFGQLIRHLEMPHIRFHDLRHTAATNIHQLTGDFYTVGEILGHTLKGIGMSLGISTNLEAVTARYVDVRLKRKKEVLDKYHTAVKKKKKEPSAGEPTKKPKKKSNDIDL